MVAAIEVDAEALAPAAAKGAVLPLAPERLAATGVGTPLIRGPALAPLELRSAEDRGCTSSITDENDLKDLLLLSKTAGSSESTRNRVSSASNSFRTSSCVFRSCLR